MTLVAGKGTSEKQWQCESITASLVQFEEDFNSRTKMWDWVDRVGEWVNGYLRPDQFLDHLTVIKSKRYIDKMPVPLAHLDFQNYFPGN